MRLIDRSRPDRLPAAAASPAGELFVASVVGGMLLIVLGDVLDPALLGDLGFEAGLFDMGGELAVLTAADWPLLQLLLLGGLVPAGIAVLRLLGPRPARPLRAADGRPPDKVPI
ncbi:MAG: hypothetical protein U1E23_13380 [Reyranellaceae bacterium]